MNCDKNDLLLYAVTDRHWLDGRRLIDVVRESLDGGVTMVQLREKDAGGGEVPRGSEGAANALPRARCAVPCE